MITTTLPRADAIRDMLPLLMLLMITRCFQPPFCRCHAVFVRELFSLRYLLMRCLRYGGYAPLFYCYASHIAAAIADDTRCRHLCFFFFRRQFAAYAAISFTLMPFFHAYFSPRFALMIMMAEYATLTLPFYAAFADRYAINTDAAIMRHAMLFARRYALPRVYDIAPLLLMPCHIRYATFRRMPPLFFTP